MRKLFIGCGVVVVLVLCVIGYAVYRVWPAFQELRTQVVQLADRLDELDAAHPFDPKEQQHLDGQRFARMLDLRVQLVASTSDGRNKLNRLWENNDEKVGILEQVKRTMSSLAEGLPQFAEHLAQAEMGPAEFAWNTRLFWSTLYRVDAGAAGPELDPLKGTYKAYRENYEHMAREQKWPPLADVIGEFPPAILAEATTVLARNMDKVRQGLADTEFDYYFMAQVNKLKEVQALREGDAPPVTPAGEQTPVPSITVPVPQSADGQ